ncbi:hypothetical protein MMUR_46070 [Mycolicibacterium murale]|uniref:Uncharacterized protein n=1 Tax=Mycolicibacterium murale TaxID=182220 RepID=A0A7I9WRU8_9MYCO|nr:hypothetical protein MMUR_46070 [Mycolicibacterium murale]
MEALAWGDAGERMLLLGAEVARESGSGTGVIATRPVGSRVVGCLHMRVVRRACYRGGQRLDEAISLRAPRLAQLTSCLRGPGVLPCCETDPRRKTESPIHRLRTVPGTQCDRASTVAATARKSHR